MLPSGRQWVPRSKSTPDMNGLKELGVHAEGSIVRAWALWAVHTCIVRVQVVGRLVGRLVGW